MLSRAFACALIVSFMSWTGHCSVWGKKRNKATTYKIDHKTIIVPDSIKNKPDGSTWLLTSWSCEVRGTDAHTKQLVFFCTSPLGQHAELKILDPEPKVVK